MPCAADRSGFLAKPVVHGDGNIRRLEIAMDDPLLMSVFDRGADFAEQLQALSMG